MGCLAIWLIPSPEGLTLEGQASLAVLVFCMVWWILAPVALPVTSLVGLALLPTLGAMSPSVTLALFGNQAVFFVIGVFIVASVMMQTGLSSRLTLLGLKKFAHNENSLCNATLFISFGLCFFVVSHAVAALMLPLILRLLQVMNLPYKSRFAKRLLLSMAWGTVCGSNISLLSSARASLALELYAGFLSQQEQDGLLIGFVEYSLASIPVAICSLLVAMIVLRFMFPPENVNVAQAVQQLKAEVGKKGAISAAEKATAVCVLLMILTMIWAGPNWLGIVALLFCGLIFGLQLLQWEEAQQYVNWGVALLYGGAIAIGAAVHKTGAASWLVHSLLPQYDVHPWIMLFIIGFLTIILTELISNSAVIAILLPVSLVLASEIGLHPMAMAVFIPVCAGFAFVLPTSTPAMAMVFGVGYLRVRDSLLGVTISMGTLLLFFLILAFWWPLIGLSAFQGVP